MSRSLLGFLLFCLLLVLATGGVVWYMGPALAGIVLDGDRRENPYYLLQLLPAAASSSAGSPSYRARFVRLADGDEGQVLWQGGAVEVMEGPVLLDVADLQLMKFETGADLVQMLTSSAYRELEADFADAPVRKFGSSVAPGALAAQAATVLALYRADPDEGDAPLGLPGEQGWLALLPDYGGQVRWDAYVVPVQSRGDWNRVLAVQFPDAGAAEAWLADPKTATERAIAGMRVDEMVVLVVQPSAVAPRWNSRAVPNSSNSPRFGNVSAGISAISR